MESRTQRGILAFK